ncbi:unnamed protein product [Mytilus coruscus]|uniref:DUF6570 domain-containing protein n=1 Tax=Mytilus coruscus TaxID=42192 RepID=A0A6J8CYS3_MYTCO|nr:unnamed protein product [Mytilus coruscus]
MNTPANMSHCFTNFKSVQHIEWICHTCLNAIKKQKILRFSIANKMGFPQRPKELNLYPLEERLLSLRIPFMQIRQLPRGGQLSVKGNVVNVPVEVQPTINSLPHTLEKSGTISVKLKKKLEFKKCDFSENVRPFAVICALHYLMRTSDLYKSSGIEINEDWITEIAKINEEETQNEKNSTEQEDNQDQNDSEDDSDHFSEVDENETHVGNTDTLLDHIPDDNPLCDTGLTFAPGEGQRPISLYSDPDAEYLSFPTIFCGQRRPDNKERSVSVHYTDIVKWELRSMDRRVAQSVPNIFFKLKKIQLKNISDKVNLALRRCQSEGKKWTAKDVLNPNTVNDLVRLDEENNTSLVNLQVHKHSKTCRKKGHPICRFGFPLPPMKATVILEPLKENDDIEKYKAIYKEIQKEINTLHNSEDIDQMTYDMFLDDVLQINEEHYIKAIRSNLSGPKVFLKRKPSEVRVNGYMKTVLVAWQANHDLQFVLDAFACAVYIVSYISKSQKGMSALLDQAAKEARQGNLDLKHQNLPPKAIISSRKTGPDSTEIESDNDIKRYSRRPKQLENWCLADYVSQLELQYPKTSESLEHETEQQENESESENEEANADVIEENKIDITLKNGIRIYQRKTPKVIRYVKYNYKTDSENFYRERLMLFYPWRNELSDLQCGHETFENMYLTVARLLEKKAKQYEGKVIDLEKAIEEAENDCNENDQIAPATQQVEMEDAEIGPTESEQYVHFNPDRPTEHRLYDMSREVGIEARTVELTNHANRISESDYFALIRSLNKKHWIFNDLSKGLTALAPNYWKLLFSFHELTEIMRQKDDLEFAQLLNRLRQNQLTENDFAVLSTRTVSITDPTYRTNVTHLFVENALVDNFNFQYISKLCSQKVKVKAVDTVCGDLPSSVKTKLLSSLPEKQSDTANLAKEVVLAIGMKYDLTANIEVTDGLTNGSSCELKLIECKTTSLRPSIIWVKFEDARIGANNRRKYSHLYGKDVEKTWTPMFDIKRSFTYKYKTFERIQFPLRPAAGKTIHKSQGDTLQEVVVSLKSKRKGKIPHIHYVALSRVTSLTELQILNLNQEAIAVAECVRQELHRLMTDATLQLCFKPLYNLSSNYFKVVFNNSRSLHAHFKDLKSDPNILDADVIGIAESRLISTDENEDFYVPGFEPPVRLD